MLHQPESPPTSDPEKAARGSSAGLLADFPLEIRVLGQPIPCDGALLLRRAADLV